MNFIPELFTPECIAHYRHLRRDYPLWCGAWPSDLRAYPDFVPWSGVRLKDPLLMVLRIPTDNLYIDDSESLPTHPSEPIQPRYLRIDPDDDDPSLEERQGLPPSRPAAVISALEFLLGRVESGWMAASHDALVHWQKSLKQAFSPSLFQESGGEPSGATRLVSLRYRMLDMERSEPERKRLAAELEKEWLKIGRRVGILPPVRGGAHCALPDAFLVDLQAEARGLVEEVCEYRPTGDHMQAVRDLVGEDPFEGMYRTRWGTVSPEIAERERQELLAEFDERHRIKLWTRVIRFPILTQVEIEKLLGQCNARPHDPLALVARRFLSRRLSISDNQLRHRLNRAP